MGIALRGADSLRPPSRKLPDGAYCGLMQTRPTCGSPLSRVLVIFHRPGFMLPVNATALVESPAEAEVDALGTAAPDEA